MLKRMMVIGNYPTKKALKQKIGKKLDYIETAPSFPEYKCVGTIVVCGPHKDQIKWAATVRMKNGKIDAVA